MGRGGRDGEEAGKGGVVTPVSTVSICYSVGKSLELVWRYFSAIPAWGRGSWGMYLPACHPPACPSCHHWLKAALGPFLLQHVSLALPTYSVVKRILPPPGKKSPQVETFERVIDLAGHRVLAMVSGNNGPLWLS